MSEELYKQAGAQAEAGRQAAPEDFAQQTHGAGEKKADGNVVDAEFEVVNEDKKK